VGFVNINPVVGAMNGMEQTEMSTVSYTEFSHQFHYFFLSAIFLLLCESALHWIPRANSNTRS